MTLIEVLVALSISAVIVTAVSGVFIQGVKHTRAISGDARLVEAASLLTNTLALHVRTARAINRISDTELEITNADYSTTRLAFTGGQVQYDGVSLLHGSAVPTAVVFRVIDNTVQMSFALSANLGASGDYVTEPLLGTTTIAVRN